MCSPIPVTQILKRCVDGIHNSHFPANIENEPSMYGEIFSRAIGRSKMLRSVHFLVGGLAKRNQVIPLFDIFTCKRALH